MLGAFFILTDPVTASATNRGRPIFGALAGLLVWLIRGFGGYPDGVALPFCWRILPSLNRLRTRRAYMATVRADNNKQS